MAALPDDAPVLGDVVVAAELLTLDEGDVERTAGDVPAAGNAAGRELSPGGLPAGESTAGEVPGDRTAGDQSARGPGAGPIAPVGLRPTFAGGVAAAELVEHNRVIVIGDSIAASTSDRYSGETCTALADAGWLVEIDAEAGRHVEFGVTVVDERLPEAEFDAAVVMLGSNYRGNPQRYEEGLRHIVAALAPRPTVVLTVTEFQPDRVEVNDVIRAVAADHDNVRVIDWAAVTAADPGLLTGDGLHLNPQGRVRFAELIAADLGEWTKPGYTGCVPSTYTDDLS